MGRIRDLAIVAYQIDLRIDGTAKLLGTVRRKMLNVGLPSVLDDVAKGSFDTAAGGQR